MAIDKHTFDRCFRESFQALSRYANLYVRDSEQSREIVQNSFLKIWEKRTSLTIKTDLRVYLYQIVKNDSLNFLRSQRKFQFTDRIPEVILTEEQEDYSPTTNDLNGLLDRLPARCREIFILKKFHGLSYRQIGLRLAISEKSVENQITIALKRLRAAVTSSQQDQNKKIYE